MADDVCISLIGRWLCDRDAAQPVFGRFDRGTWLIKLGSLNSALVLQFDCVHVYSQSSWSECCRLGVI